MGATFLRGAVATHHKNLDVPLRQAKVHGPAHKDLDALSVKAKVHSSSHKKVAISQSRADMARWIDRARALSRLTSDQFADAVGCHPSQFSKWVSATEPPQIERVLLSPMRSFLLQAIAEETPGCSVHTTITVVRSA